MLDKSNVSEKHDSIVDSIVKIDKDVLGAYFFHEGEIHLYWLVIGLFSLDYGVSPESMTAVVAAHEWAHAYTHLGADVGGRRWETDAFASCSFTIVESLAQYYGGLACERLSNGCFDAYLKLLAKQPEPYRWHLCWFGGNACEDKDNPSQDWNSWLKISNPDLREAVRFALLEARSRNYYTRDDFTNALNEVGSRLQPKK